MWKNFAGIDDGECVAFAVKKPKEIHVYKTDKCSFGELVETIGHEVGHFQSKFS